ncbi:hypothetical protein PIB30_042291 [Stylosanthes scabra]|uniref:Uncharacterized protein n=1 Tax=Stylosanthes scabra TaxID=79078 RepID=A0ABU6VI34_9FABA|nr:hypothetical protein [Stylosanthes scabra]
MGQIGQRAHVIRGALASYVGIISLSSSSSTLYARIPRHAWELRQQVQNAPLYTQDPTLYVGVKTANPDLGRNSTLYVVKPILTTSTKIFQSSIPFINQGQIWKIQEKID